MYILLLNGVHIISGLVNKDNTRPTLFEYPEGKSSSDFTAPSDYVPQFAGFEDLSPEDLSTINNKCGDDYVRTELKKCIL